jgi:hypothetical protein
MECLAVKTYRHLLSILLLLVVAVVVIKLFLVVVVQAVCLAELHQLQAELTQSP